MTDLEIRALRHVKQLAAELSNEIISKSNGVLHRKENEDIPSNFLYTEHGKSGDIERWIGDIMSNSCQSKAKK
jgi:hypothetical protein